MLLVSRFRWITYTSCEGHSYEEFDITPVGRHVGIFPRSDAESQTINDILKQVTTEVNAEPTSTAVSLEVVPQHLDAGSTSYMTVDLRFQRRDAASWTSYFQDVETVYTKALRSLERIAPPRQNPRGMA